ncbi:unnamed protein product [Brassica oleracea var. botrytis]|uniref:Uncharacterized protein n=1 Tax=Brassica oleracea TaxID=3712 RepID=A0A3P6ENI3_BRAOL|nr:PREDICTED: uncharacterized protein LOC106319758 [Brassica oleracea var. oleracea]VDD37731.1 unnamed protein product [Brassica oleracea]
MRTRASMPFRDGDFGNQRIKAVQIRFDTHQDEGLGRYVKGKMDIVGVVSSFHIKEEHDRWALLAVFSFWNWQESGIPVTEGYGFSLVSSNQLKTLFQYNQLDGKAFLLVIHFDGLGTRGKVWLRVQVHDLPNTSRLVYDGLFVEKGSNF